VAVFNLRCKSCGAMKRVFADKLDVMKCKCGADMVRVMGVPSTHIMERLDNGIMPRALERYADAERLFKERHDNADPLAGTTLRHSFD